MFKINSVGYCSGRVPVLLVFSCLSHHHHLNISISGPTRVTEHMRYFIHSQHPGCCVLVVVFVVVSVVFSLFWFCCYCCFILVVCCFIVVWLLFHCCSFIGLVVVLLFNVFLGSLLFILVPFSLFSVVPSC